eukprot:1518728-Prymnesium_polylepis.2
MLAARILRMLRRNGACIVNAQGARGSATSRWLVEKSHFGCLQKLQDLQPDRACGRARRPRPAHGHQFGCLSAHRAIQVGARTDAGGEGPSIPWLPRAMIRAAAA